MRPSTKRAPVGIEGHVRDLAFGGEGVVVTDAGVLFVAGVLPGETVRVVPERAGKPPRGRLLEVLSPSVDRVEPPCPIADRCGGCPLMSLAPHAQRHAKRAWIEKAVAEVGAPAVEEVAAERALGYRRRARFRWRGAPRALGFDVARTRTLVDIERCAVLEPALSLALDAVRSRLLPHLSGQGELALALGAGGVAVARVTSDATQRPATYEAARTLVERADLAGVVLEIAGAGPASIGDPREHTAGLDGLPLVGTPAGGFSQANREVNDMLVRKAVELASHAGRRVLELYAGHGNLTIALALEAQSVVAVETDRHACTALRANLEARAHRHVRVVEALAADHVARVGRSEHDVLVVDPPRGGLDRAVLARIPQLRIPRIVYVSCNPPVLARDLAQLASHGYRADRAVALEMFPQTSHVEALVSLGTGSP
ncbi:MAG: class I SAM-dependent RNA methyltransferase [Deltaproteobacteria bacterium]|nr:class I SAM-dependent RNA methyltransferase [Deltaproteobacteria bacterium]